MSQLATHVVTLAGHVHTAFHSAAAAPTPIPSPTTAPVVTPVPASTTTTTTRSTGSSGFSFTLPALVLTLLVWSTLVGAVIALFTPERSDEMRGRLRATGLVASGIAFTVALLTTFGQISTPAPGGGLPNDTTGANLVENRNWLTDFPFSAGYHFDSDGISLPLVMLSCVVFLAAFALMWKRRDGLRLRVSMLLLAETGVNGALSARDVVMISFFLALVVGAMYMLIRQGVHGSDDERLRRRLADRFLILGLAAVGLFTAGLLIAVTHAAATPLAGAPASTFNIDTLSGQTFPTTIAISGFALMFLGFVILAGIFPFHRWLIDVIADTDAQVAMVAVGIVSRLAGFVMLRFALYAFPNVAITYSTAIAALAVVTALWGAFGAVAATDIRRLIGNVALVETAVVLLGFSGVNSSAFVGSIIVLVGGGLSAVTLLLAAHTIEDRTRQRDLRRFGGLALQMPKIAAFWAVAVLCVSGVPLLAGFTGDFILFTGTFAQHRWATLLVVAALGVAACALLWSFQRIFLGPPRDIYERVKDGAPLEYFALSLPVALIVLYGLLPGRIMLTIANGASIIASRLGG